VKTGNVRIRSDMFRCTRWFGVNYFHRDKQRPMVKKVFPETNYTNPLYSVCDIRDIIYKISRKSLDIECEICFLFSFFASLSTEIIYLPLSSDFSLFRCALIIVLLGKIFHT